MGDEAPTGAVEKPAEAPEEARETWNNKIDFLLACIGFSVGLGNVWRFPYLCYKNGGGAFLIPYFVCVLIGGIPLFFLEVAVGQYMSEGGIRAWRICPILQGIGWATTVIVFFLNCYYNVILAWAFYYFFASFTTNLPWDSCDNYWNTDRCTLDFSKVTANMTNATETSTMSSVNITNFVRLDPTTEFWENKVLNISGGIDEPVQLKWDLVLCLLLAWCVVYFCIWKGIRTSGKVMYVTATSPYIFMLILLIRGAMLPGAGEGIKFYLIPDFTKLLNMEVWVDAGTQIFFSYSIAIGALTVLGSFNKFNHNSYRDVIIFAMTNSGTSIFAGFVIFSNLGFMAVQQGVPVGDVAKSGPGLAFIAYPKAVAQMPVAPLWSIMFFLMLILLGLDSQFVGVEGLVTAFVDLSPSLRKGNRRELFVAGACFVQFLVGLSMVTNGGMYVFQLFDYYSGSKILLFVATFMCIAMAWIFGINRWYDSLELMYGFRVNIWWKICWLALSPAFCMAVFVMSIINYSELSYDRPTGTYHYPKWAVGIGWTLAACSGIWIPIIAVYKLITYPMRGLSLSDVLKPEDLRPHQLTGSDRYAMDNGYSIPTILKYPQAERKEIMDMGHYNPTVTSDTLVF